jgi:glycosyltransferase involved in cell wall biosynthesis
MIKLAVVVPCFNEEEVLPELVKRMSALFIDLISKGKISDESFVLLVDDGSVDNTWNIITEFYKQNKVFKGLKLARNVGHQNALISGLHFATNKCDACISVDADLQDDLNVFSEMIDGLESGFDIVYGVRSSRKKDTLFKRSSARFFYRLMLFMGVRTVYNHADFRLLSNRALRELKRFKEKNLFIRGIVPLIGFKSEKIYYVREERFAGKTKYPLKKMLNFALDGITSFSVKPLRIIFLIGCFILLASIVSFAYIMISYFGGGNIAGWTSNMISIWFLGSLTIISLGIIGEYIGKIYTEVKDRPLYNVEKYLFDEDDTSEDANDK